MSLVMAALFIHISKLFLDIKLKKVNYTLPVSWDWVGDIQVRRP